MRRTLLCAAGLGALCISTSAHADRLAAARNQPLAEVSHAVTVRIDGGVARYVVRRTFANPGVQADEASLRLDLAHGAAVTGLRIRARTRWYDGELMEAEEARAKYQELTGVGAWDPKDPALLQWVWADEAHLQVFPVLPGAVSTVEYTLTAPLQYRDGRYLLTYPRSAPIDPDDESLVLADPVLVVEPGHGDAATQVIVGGQRVAPGTPVVLGALPPPKWVGDGEPEPGYGYAHSAVEVPDDITVAQARVKLEIDHTYSGDLNVELVDPTGARHHVASGDGGENDIRGEFEVEFDDPPPSRGSWTLVVCDAAGLDVGTLDAWSLELVPKAASDASVRVAAAGLPVFIPDARDDDGSGGHALLEIEAPPIRKLDARLGRVVASSARGFSRLELDAAAQLGALPKQASVVFVVDVSRSLAYDDVDEQLRIAAAYLTHVPDAQVEVVVFDRGARRLFDGLVPATEFMARIDAAREAGKLARRNGSALELGLELAAQVLRGRKGPARIVAGTDGALRGRFRNAMADHSLSSAPGAITHLVIPHGGRASLERFDDHALAPIAAAHRGVLYLAAASEFDKPDERAKAMLGLVRPVAIDHFAVRGLDLSPAGDVPEALREGSSYRAMLHLADPPKRVVVTGKLWAEDFRRVVAHEREFDVATAGFVFSEDEFSGLSHEEMLTVAFMGRAVSPVTSYLAVEPGVRPSTAGLERESIGFGGTGLIGRGGGGGTGSSVLPRLGDLLAPAVRRCTDRLTPAAGWAVDLEVETTGPEIVDVMAIRATDPTLSECIVDGVWGTLLPAGQWPTRETHTLAFR